MLTSLGRNTVLASLALYGVAYGLGYSELAVPAVAGGAAVLAGVVMVSRRPRLRVSLDITPTRVSRGQHVTATVRLRNEAMSWSPRFAVHLPHGAGSTQVVLKRLGGGEGQKIPLALRCERRGLVQIGPLTVQQNDTFGLCRRVKIVADPVTIHVYPVIHPLPVPSAARLHRTEGPASQRTPHGGIAFHSLREYVPGDDLRYVHWRATAKIAASSGNLLVREHLDAADALSAVLLDTCRRSYPEALNDSEDVFEAAVEFAASVLVASAQRGLPISLHTASGIKVRGNAGQADVWRILDALTRVRADDGDALTQAALAIVRSPGLATSRAGTLTVVTGADGNLTGSAVQRLSRCFDRVIVARIGQAAATSTASTHEPQARAGTRLCTFAAVTAADAAGKWAALAVSGQARS